MKTAVVTAAAITALALAGYCLPTKNHVSTICLSPLVSAHLRRIEKT